METNIEKLARLEKELAEVRENLERDSTPEVDYGQYYRKNGNYYVVTRAFNTYIMSNLTYGTHWTCSGTDQNKIKKELRENCFVYVGKYEDYLKAIRG
jgi:hypothetical protein